MERLRWIGGFLVCLAVVGAAYTWVGRPVVEAGGNPSVLSALSWLRGWTVSAEEALGVADRIALSVVLLATFVLAFTMQVAGLLSRRSLIVVLLLIGGGLRLHIASGEPIYLYHWPLDDDSYYFFEVAYNLANGNGLRHDSFHTTTGVQPLFALLITPVFWLVSSKTLAVTTILHLQVGVSLLLALALSQLIRTIAGETAAFLALATWAFSGYWASIDMNGLETGLSLLFVCLVCQRYYTLVQSGTPPSPRALVELGALLGMAFLARNDNGLLGAGIALHMLLTRTKWLWPMQRRLRDAAILAAAAGVFALPWLVLNLILAGSPLPSGGQAVRFLSLAYGFNMMEATGPAFAVEEVPFDYYRATLSHAMTILRDVLDRGIVPLWAGALLVAAGAVAGWKHGLGLDLRRLAFFWVFLAGILVAYTLYILGQWFFDRYFAPIAVGYLLVLAIALQALLTRVSASGSARRRKLVEVGLAVALASSLLADSVHVLAPPQERVPGFYDAARWLNRNTPEDSVVAAFQSGIFGFHAERPFHGLDGKINLEALDALRAGRIDEYILENEIDYVVDWPFILDALLSNRARDPGFLERQQLVYSNGEVLVYRVVPQR